jgi:hypothetical protein
VAHDLGEGTESGHRIVGVTLAEVQQDLFGSDPQMPVSRGRVITQS